MDLATIDSTSVHHNARVSPALLYWVAVAALGFAAALGSGFIGLSYRRYLREQHPNLVATYRAESVRDGLLVVGLGLNVLVGILASMGPIRSGIGLVAVLGGATCLSAFAMFNFWLRVSR